MTDNHDFFILTYRKDLILKYFKQVFYLFAKDYLQYTLQIESILTIIIKESNKHDGVEILESDITDIVDSIYQKQNSELADIYYDPFFQKIINSVNQYNYNFSGSSSDVMLVEC